MSWPYLHTLVNHFPIVLTVVGALALLLALMYERRPVWMYALSTLTLAGITIYPAWITGERASKAVRNVWYIERGTVNTHSSAADVTLWMVGATGLIALIALITMMRTRAAVSPARALRVLLGLGALLSIAAVLYTGFLGGKIVVESSILSSPMPPLMTAPAPGTPQATATDSAAAAMHSANPAANPPTNSSGNPGAVLVPKPVTPPPLQHTP